MTISAERLRHHLLGLPGVEERETWGHPTFRVGGRLFASLPDGTTAIVKASPSDQAALVAEAPDTFGVAPRVGRYGWVTVSLRRVRADQARELVELAWQATAPRGLLTRRTNPRSV